MKGKQTCSIGGEDSITYSQRSVDRGVYIICDYTLYIIYILSIHALALELLHDGSISEN